MRSPTARAPIASYESIGPSTIPGRDVGLEAEQGLRAEANYLGRPVREQGPLLRPPGGRQEEVALRGRQPLHELALPGPPARGADQGLEVGAQRDVADDAPALFRLPSEEKRAGPNFKKGARSGQQPSKLHSAYNVHAT